MQVLTNADGQPAALNRTDGATFDLLSVYVARCGGTKLHILSMSVAKTVAVMN